MAIKKKLAALGAAMVMTVSASAIGASAYQASYKDNSCIILSYTSTTSDKASATGTVTNLSNTKTNYSIQTTLYYKTSAAKIGYYSSSGWKTAKLSKNKVLKATSSHSRNTNYSYSARTQVMKNNSIFKVIQSQY